MALWWLADDPRLTTEARRRLTDPANRALLSAAVVWEVAIKRSLGKLDAPEAFAHTLLGAGAVALPVTVPHAEAVGALPWHHRDPFDRMLVAQARVESLVLVSKDDAVRRYGVAVAW